jgi:inorganic pyrophosphatase
MSHFFKVYKNLEHKETAVNEVRDREASLKIIEKAIDDYVEKFCK